MLKSVEAFDMQSGAGIYAEQDFITKEGKIISLNFDVLDAVVS